MPQTTITAGLSIKRPGAEQYSSDGFHLSVEMEADVENAEQFHAVSRALFLEVKAALEAQVAGGPSSQGSSSVDLWAASSGAASPVGASISRMISPVSPSNLRSE